MKLTQIEIENFRCFERLTVPLEPDVTAFIGVNAAGKTALLDAIALVLDPLLQRTVFAQVRASGSGREDEMCGVSLVPGDLRIGVAADSALGHPSVLISATAVDETATQPQAQLKIRWERSHGVDASGVAYTTARWVEPVGITPAQYGLWIWMPGADAASAPTGMQVDTPVVAYYRAHRRFSEMPVLRDVFAQRLDRDAAFFGALDAGADYEAMCRWFYMRENQELRERLQHRDDPDFAFPDLVALRIVAQALIDGVKHVYFDDNPPRLKVDVKGPGGKTQSLVVSQLSDGQRNLLALALDFGRRLALANPGRTEPLNAPGILLIDEIELHLHPRWQQTVIPSLHRAFPNTQIIVATHSPQVLTTLERRQIRIVRGQQVLAAPIETFGADAGRAQRLVMETDTRPAGNPFAKSIDQLYTLINADNLPRAERLLAELEGAPGGDDPALIEARTLIDNRKWEQELGL